MNKPITVARHDFIETLVALINGSGLPAFMVVEILKSCITEMEPMVDSQYKKDREEYEKAVMMPEVVEDGMD